MELRLGNASEVLTFGSGNVIHKRSMAETCIIRRLKKHRVSESKQHGGHGDHAISVGAVADRTTSAKQFDTPVKTVNKNRHRPDARPEQELWTELVVHKIHDAWRGSCHSIDVQDN